MLKKIVLISIIFYSFKSALVSFKTNLDGFLNFNKGCEFICKHPYDIHNEQLMPIKKYLPKYKKIGFITDKCTESNSRECWFKYRITRYFLYPSLLENSGDYDIVVSFLNNHVTLFEKKKNDS